MVILDQAGWHASAALAVPANITLLPLPLKCPELNPVENVWQCLARQLALKHNLHILRRHRRSLLQRLEQARRATSPHHLDRLAPKGAWVRINEDWYQW